MNNMTEKEIRNSTRYPCGAYVRQSKHFARPCRNQAVLLFVLDEHTPQERIYTCACQQHREVVRAAVQS